MALFLSAANRKIAKIRLYLPFFFPLSLFFFCTLPMPVTRSCYFYRPHLLSTVITFERPAWARTGRLCLVTLRITATSPQAMVKRTCLRCLSWSFMPAPFLNTYTYLCFSLSLFRLSPSLSHSLTRFLSFSPSLSVSLYPPPTPFPGQIPSRPSTQLRWQQVVE